MLLRLPWHSAAPCYQPLNLNSGEPCLPSVVRKPLQISSEDSYVNLASETSDESYSAFLDLSRILNSAAYFAHKRRAFLQGITKMLAILILVAALLIQSGCSSDSETDTPTALNYTQKGWRAYNSGDYTQALLSFERALNFNAELADAHNGVGWSHLSLSLTIPIAQEAFQMPFSLMQPMRTRGLASQMCSIYGTRMPPISAPLSAQLITHCKLMGNTSFGTITTPMPNSIHSKQRVTTTWVRNRTQNRRLPRHSKLIQQMGARLCSKNF